MAGKKNQHYVPKFLLTRFAQTEGRWAGHIFRLDKRTGRPGPAVPRHEAATNRYYDLPDELVGAFQPETILGQIESSAATALNRLEGRVKLPPHDVVALAYFAALQTSRTPQDRAELRFFDEFMATKLQALRFSATDKATAFLMADDPSLTPQAAERERLRIVGDLLSGKLRLESSVEREIGGMFLGLNETAGALAANADWTLVEFDDAAALVLPDSGYTRYDPAPSVPGAGSGFLGSATAQTVIPIRLTRALLITKGTGVVGYAQGDPDYADDLNLRAYAQAERCIYGQTQQDVVDVRLLARSRRRELAARRRRARIIWIGEGKPGMSETGSHLFTGHSVEGPRTQRFFVHPGARSGRGLKPDDLWERPPSPPD